MILRLAEHYTQNVATRFIRPLLVPVLSAPVIDHRISDLTEYPLDALNRGIPLDELYLQINALARFISDVRTTVIPSLNSSIGGRSFGSSENDPQRIFCNMAISNFGPNIDILEQYTIELFEAAVCFDKSNSKAKPLYEKIPENVQTAHLLRL